jgi:LPS sulfotransferase NodH
MARSADAMAGVGAEIARCTEDDAGHLALSTIMKLNRVLGRGKATLHPSEWKKIRLEMSPEYDFPPVPCRFKYLVCATPRSGSTLLCRGLTSTERAGRPAEYLSGPYGKVFRERTGRLWLPEYFDFLLRRRTSANGVFGLKMHFDQLSVNMPEKEEQVAFLGQFDQLIFMTRRDKLAQAVSLWKAYETGIYRLADHETAEQLSVPPVEYAFHNIAGALSVIAYQEANWRTLLADFADKTFGVTYEDLAGDYASTMQRLLDAMGLGEAIQSLGTRPPGRVQRDHVNREWERRFLSELRPAADASPG